MFFGNQKVEVFDVFGCLEVQRTTHFLLQDLAGGLEQAGPWSDGVAWEMRFIDGVRWVAKQLDRKTVFGIFYRLYEKQIVHIAIIQQTQLGRWFR